MKKIAQKIVKKIIKRVVYRNRPVYDIETGKINYPVCWELFGIPFYNGYEEISN